LLVVAAAGLFAFGAFVLGRGENDESWMVVDSGSSQSGEEAIVSSFPNEEMGRRATNKKEKIRRFEEIFSSLPGETVWAAAERERIATEIRAWAVVRRGVPEIVSLDCRGNHLCRVVLDYKTGEAALASRRALVNREVFSWRGGMTSTSAPGPSESGYLQLLFLLAEGYGFDGHGIVKVTNPSMTNRGGSP
jgi:hypothetical protein